MRLSSLWFLWLCATRSSALTARPMAVQVKIAACHTNEQQRPMQVDLSRRASLRRSVILSKPFLEGFHLCRRGGIPSEMGHHRGPTTARQGCSQWLFTHNYMSIYFRVLPYMHRTAYSSTCIYTRCPSITFGSCSLKTCYYTYNVVVPF